MIEYSSNMKEVIQEKLAQLKALKDNPDPILRTVALTILPELKKRVHQDGKDSAGNQIGTYSPGYMKVRTGNYKNSGRISRGKNKGKLKDAGMITKRGYRKFTQEDAETVSSERKFLKTEHEGVARPRYNRTGDTKVILSLTRQMENDTSVIQTDTGYGIGYLNPLNYQKALWCEETYKKPILTKLTDEENDLAQTTAREFTTEYLKAV
jgi:hypothetical protein